MTVFGEYAQFYDAVYKDKDYGAECDFLEAIFAAQATGKIKSILDLGCGTGEHAEHLLGRGYSVTGVDQSEQMLAVARRKNANTAAFVKGDIRTVELNTHYDAVLAMFAVIGYMITNDDLIAAFKTARKHLKPGGLFVFDTWFGPAVLADRPVDRYKIIQPDLQHRVIRFAHPEMNLLEHVVNVNYKVLELQGNQVVNEVDETHPMRFMFVPELRKFLELAGFKVRQVCPFLALEASMTERDWNLTIVAEAVEPGA